MAPRLTDEQRRLRQITEATFQQQILELAQLCGWKTAHFHDSRRQVRPGVFVGDKDAKGFPDLILARPPDLVAWEVKKETGVVSDDQIEWLKILHRCGVEARLVRPSDWDYVQERLR